MSTYNPKQAELWQHIETTIKTKAQIYEESKFSIEDNGRQFLIDNPYTVEQAPTTGKKVQTIRQKHDRTRTKPKAKGHHGQVQRGNANNGLQTYLL